VLVCHQLGLQTAAGAAAAAAAPASAATATVTAALAASFELRVQAWHAHGQQHHMELLLGHL